MVAATLAAMCSRTGRARRCSRGGRGARRFGGLEPFRPHYGERWGIIRSRDVVVEVPVKRALGGIVIALGMAAAVACGEGEETCVCSCECGSGAKSTLDGADSIESCSNLCDTQCGNDSFESHYDCKTEG